MKKTARRVLGRFGFEVRRISYRPWETDTAFQNIYRRVRANTLVDEYRCHELWTLVDEVKSVPGDIVEVGVWRGGSGALIASRAKQLAPEATVWLCDTFRGVVKARADELYRGGEHADTSVPIVRQLLSENGLDNVRLLEGIFPDDTASQIDSHQIRLCHIDVDVRDSAKGVMDWAWPRMPIGGIVVYDDYGFRSCPGITDYVNEQRGMRDRVVIHNLNMHAIVVKIA